MRTRLRGDAVVVNTVSHCDTTGIVEEMKVMGREPVPVSFSRKSFVSTHLWQNLAVT